MSSQFVSHQINLLHAAHSRPTRPPPTCHLHQLCKSLSSSLNRFIAINSFDFVVVVVLLLPQPLPKCSVNEDAVDAHHHREAAAAGTNKTTASPGHVTETEDDQSWAKYTNFQIL